MLVVLLDAQKEKKRIGETRTRTELNMQEGINFKFLHFFHPHNRSHTSL